MELNVGIECFTELPRLLFYSFYHDLSRENKNVFLSAVADLQMPILIEA